MKTLLCLLLLSFPLCTYAQVYKCKQANGSTSFQEQPCPEWAKSSTLALPATPSEPVGNQSAQQKGSASKAGATQKDINEGKLRDAQRARADREINEANERVRAENQAQRCYAARNQLGILKEPRPVFRRDNNGDRQYVQDDDRQAEIAAATRRVAADCK